MSEVVFITGASRGIGLGLTRAYLERGAMAFASARTPDSPGLRELRDRFPERCRIVELDLLNPDHIVTAVGAVDASGQTLDVLIHNAGIFAAGEEGLETIDRARMLEVMETNVVAPLELTRALLPFLRAPGGIVAALTSGSGQKPTERKGPGGQYSYGISKAALYAAIWHLEGDLYPRGIASIGLNPGFVRTDMTSGAPVRPPLSVDESVRAILQNLDSVHLEDSGRVFGV